MTAQPCDQLVEAELVGFVEGGNENVGLPGVRRQTRAADGEKSIRRGECRPLVAVDEGTICARLSPERTGFLDQVGVISGLRPVERGFQQPFIPHAVGAAVPGDLVGMHGHHFRRGEVVDLSCGTGTANTRAGTRRRQIGARAVPRARATRSRAHQRHGLWEAADGDNSKGAHVAEGAANGRGQKKGSVGCFESVQGILFSTNPTLAAEECRF
ncbi:MAG: hypothetical protein JWO80_838 [Bryobacterales bacterium]|nr:hypothetical protein [Bryobacterales bacterium]